ncbi:MAG: hypothetical protein AB7D00_12260 [Rhodospirillaceae bacterium]
MPDCPCLPKCPFFNDRMAGMPTMANQLKDKFCKGDNAECARFMVFSQFGSERVPPTLFPSQVDQAKRLIAAS